MWLLMIDNEIKNLEKYSRCDMTEINIWRKKTDENVNVDKNNWKIVDLIDQVNEEIESE